MEMDGHQADGVALRSQTKLVPKLEVKMEDPEPAAGQQAEEVPPVIQAAAFKAFFGGNVQVKEEVKEDLPDQWDAQLQEFVRRLGNNPQLLRPMSRNDSKAFLAPFEGPGDTSQLPRQEGVIQGAGFSRESLLVNSIPLDKIKTEDGMEGKEEKLDEEIQGAGLSRESPLVNSIPLDKIKTEDGMEGKEEELDEEIQGAGLSRESPLVNSIPLDKIKTEDGMEGKEEKLDEEIQGAGLSRESPLVNSIPLDKIKTEDGMEGKEEKLDEETASWDIQCQRFRRFCYDEGEGPVEVCVRLQELCLQWLKPERHTKEQILELVILEQFLAILPQKMQSWVRGSGPENCAQAVVLVEDFLCRHQEDKMQEEQISGAVKEEAVEFPKPGRAPLNTWWKPNLKIKQEDGGKSTSLDGKSLCEKGNTHSENSRGKQPGGMTLGEEWKVSHGPDPGHASETQKGNQPEKKQGKSIHSQGDNKRLGENTDLQGIRKGAKENICFQCGKVYKRRYELTIHERSHTGERPYECSECGKSFSSKERLRRHETIHTGEWRHKCTDCGKGFSHKTRLITHQRNHTGERPYSCFKCGKSFSDPDNCRKHERIHSAEKPYKCFDCGKGFHRNTHLKEHKRIHTKERPFHCSDCGKRYSYKSYLHLHGRIHTGEKPHQCGGCEKSFSQLSSLYVHKRTHTEDKPFKCSQCGKSYGEKRQLLSHQRIHPENKP
ncbi:zinc finger and SCAN domain-containing protein 30-like isoform X2 [Hemicordylus capensis]|uniref:zinc finger and SCAN domain-containing protein 30-like isoform X2 n=1 Tax=Hemicordylus capensis TaxID=884348 RepID=UPI00230465FE|nr:zinc finger and SCAN domain-containing protein 30-like isoform X2 [Hemicordylus capensis]